MKRTPVDKIDAPLSHEIERFVSGARIFDSSCSPEARVYFIDRDLGYYLKIAGKGRLEKEARMTRYFHKKGLSAEVLDYQTKGEHDLLLTAQIQGEDCTHAQYLANPRRLCEVIATKLRELHEIDASDCPIKDKMTSFVNTAKRNYVNDSYDKSHFPDSFGFESGEAAYRALCESEAAFKSDVLLHGDYCLPNVMLNDWKLSGFIDVGNGGVGDRHVDLFWGTWTLNFNLKTDQYRNRFLDAYGRDVIEPEMLDLIAACEVFG